MEVIDIAHSDGLMRPVDCLVRRVFEVVKGRKMRSENPVPVPPLPVESGGPCVLPTYHLLVLLVPTYLASTPAPAILHVV